jgi:hypothetical protein
VYHLLIPVALVAALLAPAPAWAQPTWWLGVGAQLGLDVDQVTEVRGKEAGGYLGVGVHVFRLGDYLLAVEGEGSVNRVKDKLDRTDESVDVWRGRLGGRVTWWPLQEEPIVVPYLRGGAVYRADRQALKDDDGFGWYAGGGVDLMLSEHWSLGGSVIYETTSLRNTYRSVILGVTLGYHFY